MVKNKRFRAAWIGALITTLLLPPTAAWAAEAPANAPEQPSAWAAQEVGMAQLQKLAADSLFGSYQLTASQDDLAVTSAFLYKKLTGKDAPPSVAQAQAPATREDAAVMLYKLVKDAHPELNFAQTADLKFTDLAALDGAEAAAVKYVAGKGIMQGKEELRLDLDEPCTREELLTLANRTYEFVLQETNTASKGLVWKVTGGKSPVYVLGSVHIADISVYPLDNIVKEAFDQADYLAVEANVTPDNASLQYMAEKAVFADGTTLDKHVSPETYKKFADKMQAYGYGPEVYGTLKPWYAALLLQNLALMESDYSASFGLDLYFLGHAAQEQKPILEVEGVKFQVDLFDTMSAELQEGFLLSMLDPATASSEAAGDALGQILALWKQGDAAKFSELMGPATEASLTDEFSKKFWDERNKHMFETIEKYSADPSGDSYFVVVGAGHLIGKKGVLTELETAGFKIEQLMD